MWWTILKVAIGLGIWLALMSGLIQFMMWVDDRKDEEDWHDEK